MLTLSLDNIISESNVRSEIGDVSDLMASITQVGMIQLPVVEPTADDADTYSLIAGHRRIAAARELGWETIDVVCIRSNTKYTKDQRIAAQWAENTQRLDLTDWEKAQVAMDLKLEGLKQTDVATAMGVSKADVSKLQKIVKTLTLDEALDDVTASQFDIDTLLELTESPIPEHTMDVMLRIVNGEDSYVFGAIRSVNAELKVVEFYEENKEQLNEWAEAGVDMTHKNPRHLWGKTTGYGPRDDPKVISLEQLGITVSKHIKLGCHTIFIDESWGHPKIVHFCMDKRAHADKGKSNVKAKNQDVATVAGADPKAALERRAEKEAKDLRRAKAAKWMASRQAASFINEYAVTLAIATWRQEDTRAATWMLGLNDERPKGADFNWYDKRLERWLVETFGADDNTAAHMWMVKMLMARKYIDKFWPPAELKELLDKIEVPDGN